MNQEDCQICGNTFLKESMLQYAAGGHICKGCSRNGYTLPTKSTKSPPKNDIRSKKSTVEQNEPKEDFSNKLFPHPENFYVRKLQEPIIGVHNATTSISKKPLQCPQLDCGKFVSVFDLTAHFKYEHKEVPHIQTHYDARSALEFSPKKIKHGFTRGMVVLNINQFIKNEVPSSSTVAFKNITNCPEEATFLVLGTRLSENELEEKQRNKKKDKPRRLKSDESIDTDKWIFWLGANITTCLSYTVAISTLDNSMRFKYFGPVLHLEEDPVNLWHMGRCLVLNGFQLVRMSDSLQKNLNLDVVVYSEE